MHTLEQLKTLLADRKTSILAKETGVSRFTIRRIVRGGSCNAGTLEALSAYFDKQAKRDACESKNG
jgi:hypothetical protein